MAANSVTSWLLCIFVGVAHVLHMFHLQMYMQEHLFTDTCTCTCTCCRSVEPDTCTSIHVVHAVHVHVVDLWSLIHVLAT